MSSSLSAVTSHSSGSLHRQLRGPLRTTVNWQSLSLSLQSSLTIHWGPKSIKWLTEHLYSSTFILNSTALLPVKPHTALQNLIDILRDSLSSDCPPMTSDIRHVIVLLWPLTYDMWLSSCDIDLQPSLINLSVKCYEWKSFWVIHCVRTLNMGKKQTVHIHCTHTGNM